MGIVTCHLVRDINSQIPIIAMLNWYSYLSFGGIRQRITPRACLKMWYSYLSFGGIRQLQWAHRLVALGIATCHLAGYVNQVVGISTLKNTKILLLRQTKKLVNQHLPLTRRYCGPHRQGYTGFNGAHTSPSPQRCLIRTRRAADLWSIRRCLCIPAYRSLAAEAY